MAQAGCGGSLSLRHGHEAQEVFDSSRHGCARWRSRWSHVIVRDNLYDKAFVETWTVGFKEYAEYVKDKTPAWAEKITSIPAKTIERLAKELGPPRRPAWCVERSRPAQQRRAGRAGHRHAGGLAQRLTGPARWLCPTRSGQQARPLRSG